MTHTETITHIAGMAVSIKGRVIQRCAVCGQKLVDSGETLVPIRLDGLPADFGVWQCGRLVRCFLGEGEGARRTLLPESDHVPEDNCLKLVEIE